MYSWGVNLAPVVTNGVPIGDIAPPGQPLTNETLVWVEAETPDACCAACTAYAGW